MCVYHCAQVCVDVQGHMCVHMYVLITLLTHIPTLFHSPGVCMCVLYVCVYVYVHVRVPLRSHARAHVRAYVCA